MNFIKPFIIISAVSTLIFFIISKAIELTDEALFIALIAWILSIFFAGVVGVVNYYHKLKK